MRVVWACKPYDTLSYDYWLTVRDGHQETTKYMARYYDCHWIVSGFEGVLRRDHYLIHGCGQDAKAFAARIAELQPDALVCYGPVEEAEWGLYRQAAPNAYFCLDYAGGPLCNIDGSPKALLGAFDHIFVAHETQARLLRSFGLPATKARGVPANFYRPIPGVPKLWRYFCPTTFSAGKRPTIVAQVEEQYASLKPSLMCGWMDNLAIVDMVRCGGIPLNKPEVPFRNQFQIGGRAPYVTMPLLYNAADVVISCSQEEGGIWTAMEALACGTPAIVMSDCDWLVAEAFTELEREFFPAIQVVNPWPEDIYRATETALASQDVNLTARLAAVSMYDFWPMYDTIDRTLKNGVALKQVGQAVA